VAAQEPRPKYCVFAAGDLSTVCYRAVRQNPAQVGDFLSYADTNASFQWWRAHLANGVSCWEDIDTADALAAKGGFPYLAQLDLIQIDPKLPWARTGNRPGHVSIWALPALLLQGVVTYIQVA
jgi:hypothetical protein